MKRLYPLLAALACSTAAAQNVSLPVALPAPLSETVQPGRLYLGVTFGLPVYWREQVAQITPVQGGALRATSGLTVAVGRQLTPRWAVQAGLSAYLVPTASAESVDNSTAPPLRYTTQATIGATVLALPLMAQYAIYPQQNLMAGLEGWLGLTPVWQRLQLDIKQQQNGQPVYQKQLNTTATDVYATGGLRFLKGLARGLSVFADVGASQRLRLSGDAAPVAAPTPTLAWLGSVGVRCQLGGRPAHRRW